MDLKQLRYFIVIAEKGNYARAADELGVTQSALTQSISRLEEGLGVRLFERGRRGAILTEAGSALMPRARLVTAEAHCAVAEMQRLGNGCEGGVRIGIGRAINPDLVLSALGELIDEGRDIPFTLAEDCSPALFQRLSKGELDFVFSAPEPNIEVSRDLCQRELCEMVEKVAVGITHPLALQKSIALSDLSEALWLCPPEGHGWKRHMYKTFQRMDRKPPHRFIRNDGPSTGLELLRHGRVVATILIDPQRENPAHQGLCVLDVPELTLNRPVFLTRRRQSRLQGNALRIANRIIQLADGARQPILRAVA